MAEDYKNTAKSLGVADIVFLPDSEFPDINDLNTLEELIDDETYFYTLFISLFGSSLDQAIGSRMSGEDIYPFIEASLETGRPSKELTIREFHSLASFLETYPSVSFDMI